MSLVLDSMVTSFAVADAANHARVSDASAGISITKI